MVMLLPSLTGCFVPRLPFKRRPYTHVTMTANETVF